VGVGGGGGSDNVGGTSVGSGTETDIVGGSPVDVVEVELTIDVADALTLALVSDGEGP
jgi:hypothetical protein